jgi:hypothetical protein
MELVLLLRKVLLHLLAVMEEMELHLLFQVHQ